MIQLITQGFEDCDYVATAVGYSRAEDPHRIEKMFAENGHACIVTDTVDEAYELAEDSAYECILATGSIYLAGEVRSLYMHKQNMQNKSL